MDLSKEAEAMYRPSGEKHTCDDASPLLPTSDRSMNARLAAHAEPSLLQGWEFRPTWFTSFKCPVIRPTSSNSPFPTWRLRIKVASSEPESNSSPDT